MIFTPILGFLSALLNNKLEFLILRVQIIRILRRRNNATVSTD